MVNLEIAGVVGVLCIFILYHLYQGAAYVPTHNRTVEQMVRASEIKSGMKVADLGSGDGRVVIAMARAGATSVGFEINPVLVWYSRRKIKRLGLTNLASISTSSFWSQNLSEFDVVTVFGIGHIMEKLSVKLSNELKPGALVVSNAFRVPGFTEKAKIGSLLVYKK